MDFTTETSLFDRRSVAAGIPLSKSTLAIQVLDNCRNELYSLFPNLDGAFASLVYRPTASIPNIETEGETLFFSPAFLLRQYGCCPTIILRGYLHVLLHCLFLHPFWNPKENLQRWDLACDMAVEYVVEREKRPTLNLPSDPIREECFAHMKGQAISAQILDQQLAQGDFPFTLEEMSHAFSFDAHARWAGRKDDTTCAASKSKWERLLTYTSVGQNGGRRGAYAGDSSEGMSPLGGSGYDYKHFLKQFAVPREEVELDTESFDYILYHYGLEHYGNMPLIEPLEYKEVCRLEELVIAIDTSGSCAKETVQQFLAETCAILTQQENFFHRMKVYLIQCDCMVQSVTAIHSQEEWAQRAKEIVIQGRGGTDFTPVFRLIERLRTEKVLSGPRALLYFTDGDGYYPRQKPDYETAFVFLKASSNLNLVPSWARKLIIDDKGG